MDALIARIRARAANPIRPPATEVEVIAAEEALGFPIPPLLRRLYTVVGNGDFGPRNGIEGVPTIPPTPGAADIVALYGQYSEPSPDYPLHQWPRGLVPLISGGCLYMECVYFLEPPFPVVLFDGNSGKWDKPVNESLSPIASSLQSRLEAWLENDRKSGVQ
jgi:hypothetical protein